MGKDTEMLTNMPKTLSDYVEAEFKPVILPKKQTFFGKKDGNNNADFPPEDGTKSPSKRL